MFRNAAGQTHGAQVIAGANAAQDPSMSGQADAAASKAQADSQKMQLQNFQKQQQESSKHQAELQKQQLAMQHSWLLPLRPSRSPPLLLDQTLPSRRWAITCRQ